MSKAKHTTVPFSKRTLEFILKASRQSNPDWLLNHQTEYETLLKNPLQDLAMCLKKSVGPSAPHFHFPQKGIGRLKRSRFGMDRDKNRKNESTAFKSWITYSATTPKKSRFDVNPNLFFLIQPKDKSDPVLCAGGLYMPTSKQIRSIRESIARDSAPYKKLFATKAFKNRFPKGFSDEIKSSRVPRGFDPSHNDIEWIKLQAFFVWRSYTIKEFSSKNFADLLAKDWILITRLNHLLDAAIHGRSSTTKQTTTTMTMKSKETIGLLDRLDQIQAPDRNMDF